MLILLFIFLSRIVIVLATVRLFDIGLKDTVDVAAHNFTINPQGKHADKRLMLEPRA
jgi:hypothetical protein